MPLMKSSLILMMLLVGMGQAYAQPVATYNVPDGVAEADVIVVGRESVTTLPSEKERHHIISVDRILKGRLANNKLVDFGVSPSNMDRMKPFYCMFLLRKHGDQLTIINKKYSVWEGYGRLVASPFLKLSPPANAQPLDLVAVELANVFLLTEQQASYPGLDVGMPLATVNHVTGYDKDGNEIVQWESAGDLIRSAHTYMRAADDLESIPYAHRQAAVTEVVDRHEPGIGKLFALRSMISGGDISKAMLQENELMNLPLGLIDFRSSLETYGQNHYDDKSLPTDDKTVSFFSQLLHSNNLDVRSGAFYVLKKMETPQSVQALDSELNESNPDLRTDVVAYICALTNGCDQYQAKTLSQPQNIAQVHDALRNWVAAQPK